MGLRGKKMGRNKEEAMNKSDKEYTNIKCYYYHRCRNFLTRTDIEVSKIDGNKICENCRNDLNKLEKE